MTWEKFKKFHIKWRFISFFRTKAYCIVDVMVTGVQVVTSQKSQGNLMFIALSYLWPMQSRPEILRPEIVFWNYQKKPIFLKSFYLKTLTSGICQDMPKKTLTKFPY